jgi:hypothetical protein
MKIFFYALREYDEKKYVEKFAEQYSFEYGFTSDYPSMYFLCKNKPKISLMNILGFVLDVREI